VTLAAAYAHCFDLVRRDDRDRWLASLFWPAEARPHAHALLAFDAEIARVREAVSQPMLGEIRYQWWRDVIEKEAPAGNPVAGALVDTISRFNLPKAELLALIEARSFDLYDDPMPTEAALENYLSDTSAALLSAIARVLAPGRLSPHCVDAAGRAYGLTQILRGLPHQVGRGQLYIPLDLLERLKLPPDSVLAHRNSPGLGLVLQTLRARVRVHLRGMRDALSGAGSGAAACLPAFLCEPYLRVLERPNLNPFATPIDLPVWRRQWALWRAARRLA
jgi:15-cis-phytoene synthase